MLELYYAAHTCSLATHIVLEEVGADFTLHRISFADEEQKSATYRRINPKARVPALVTSDGVLTETPAMLAYVAQCYPHANLAPLDSPFEFAEVQAVNSYLCSSLHVAHAHRMRGHRWTDEVAAVEALQRFVPVSVGECYAYIEREVLRGPWVMGDRYSLADPYLFTIAQWLEADGVDPQKFPRVIEHRERVRARGATVRAIAAELADEC